MKVNKVNSSLSERKTGSRNINNNQNNSFKGIDSFCLSTADLIENGGLAVSFTLQDMLGTNFPRPIMGLMRNQNENHGQKNFSFAAKEFVREFLTGPSMFIIPGTMLWASKKMFGKAMEVPARYIKAFGGIHAENAAKYTKNNAKQEFYSDVFAEIIKNAKGEQTASKETLSQAADFAQELSKGIKSTEKNGLKNTVETLSDKFISISKSHAKDAVYTDFTAAKTAGNTIAPFKNTVSRMISYADDIVVKAADKTGNVKEFISKTVNNKAAGRFALNTIMYSSVMSFLWLIPKLYNAAEGKKNAGLRGLMQDETFNDKELNAKYASKNAGSSRKAASPAFGSAVPFADKITGTGALSKFADIMEFEGCNVSYPLLTGIMLGGILAPRTLRAKDKYDREEIVRRDAATCAVMCLGAKELEKGFSKYNEASSGLVLASKDKGHYNKGLLGRLFDYLRPIKGVRMLSTDKIRSKYSNIQDYMDGIKGFCGFISEQGGNLGKVFSLTDKSKEIVNGLLAKEGKNLASADNKTITRVLSQAEDSKEVQELMELFKDKDNPWVKKARTLNARFTALSVLVLVPLFLGFMLPAINERATKRRIKEEQAALEAQKTALKTAGSSTNQKLNSSFDILNTADKNSVFAGMNKKSGKNLKMV